MPFNIIIQARCGSKRFPNKILQKIKNETLIEFMISRICSKFPKKNIIIATTDSKKDDKLISVLKKNKIKFFRGSEVNVLQRYYRCCKKFKIKNIVHLTSDCPLVDTNLIYKMIHLFKKKKLDYLANTYPPHKSTYPDGTDIEIYKYSSLKKLKKLTNKKEDKEHVTNFFWKNPNLFKVYNLRNKINLSKYKYSIDYKNELFLIKSIIKNCEIKKIEPTYKNIVKIIKSNKKLNKISKVNLFKFKKNRKDLYPLK